MSLSGEVVGYLFTFAGVIVTSLAGYAVVRANQRSQKQATGADFLRAAVAEWKALAESAKTDSQSAMTKATEAAEQARRAERKADDLRDIVEAWVAWGRRIHDEWPTLRLRDDPPAFPRVADLDLDSSQPMRPRRR